MVTLSGGDEAVQDLHDRGRRPTIDEWQQRVAYCECGSQLAGANEQELFDAVQRHLAHRHPELLGALGLEVVQQMAENVRGR
jgi:hypothetical protein